MVIWLDNSRIFTIFTVVFLHVSAGVVQGYDVGSEYWWFGHLYDSIVRWCVPVFVMMSGALLLDHNKKEDLSSFYRKRLSRILWPILFWSAFFLFWAFLKGFIKGNPPSVVELVKILLSGIHYHLWFLYMILGLYLFTPFFRKIVSHSTNRELIILVCVMFIIAAINAVYRILNPGGPNLFINWFLYYTPYFIMGHIVRQTVSKPSKIVLFVIFGFSFLATAFGCYFINIRSDLNTGFYFYDYFSVTVIPMSISMMFLLKTWESPIFSERVSRKLAALTLGIYLIHPIILEIMNYKTLGAFAYNPLVSVPVTTVFVFIISLIGAWVIYQIPYIKRTI